MRPDDDRRGVVGRVPSGRRGRILLAALPATLLQAALFGGALAVMLGLSVVRMDGYTVVYEFTLEHYVAAVADPLNLSAWRNTLVVSALATAATVALGYPLAYVTARGAGRYRKPLLFLAVVPLWVNFVIRVYGLRTLLWRGGAINSLLLWAGVIDEPLRWLIDTRFAVWLGQVYLLLPLVVLPLYVSLRGIDRGVIEAAYDLGASRWAVFRRVILPLSRPGLAAGIVFLVVFNMGMFIGPGMLGDRLYVGPQIDRLFGPWIDWPAGAALAVVLILAVLGALWGLLRRADPGSMLGRRGLGSGPAGATDQPGGRWTTRALHLAAALGYALMYVPIGMIVLFSVERGAFPGFPWGGFTLEPYRALLASSAAVESIENSLVVATAATAVATVVGTLAAAALVRLEFRFKRAFEALMIAPLTVPWVVLGIALLFIYSTVLRLPTGLYTVALSQLVFLVPVVTLTVSARLRGIDRALEEAARDMGADEATVYRRVTLPLLAPGIAGGALFAFGLSMNDFLVAFFTSGVHNTLPVWIYATALRGTLYVTYAVSTLTIAGSVVLLAVALAVFRWWW